MRQGQEQQVEDENYWQNELASLNVEPKRKNELNDKGELEALATAIKEVYFQDYKTAYSSNGEIDESHFDHII
ncbi:MAG TPA: hypothetical protein VFQ47_00790 [Nitrososphaera sp.]|nr:hypothetical protein [Nitrososphaera sp.]